jgi:ferritin-like metal-binding protein YciE
MPKVTDARDLLVQQLAVVYGSEKAIEGMLQKLAREANDEELAAGFERHREETRRQIANLEQAFQLLGEKPRRAKAPAVEGLELQHKAFAADAADDVLPEVLDLVALASASSTEHFEIAAYETLIMLAESLEATELVRPLQENLEQEQRMLGEAKGLAQRLAGALRGEDGSRSLTDELADGVRDAARRLTGEEARPEAERR